MSDNTLAKEQAMAQMTSIREMVAALECDWMRLEELREELNDACEAEGNDVEFTEWLNNAANDDNHTLQEAAQEMIEMMEAAGDCKDYDKARERIQEDALSVEVRGNWHTPGDSDGSAATEYKILLCTGGPAVQILGDLDEYLQPESARLMCQDWFTSWEEVTLEDEDIEALKTYAGCFYFGE